MPKKLGVGELPLKPSKQTRDPDEIPELTEEYFARAAIYDGKTLVRPGRGRPKLAAPKQQITLRLDRAVIAAFRAIGSGWQTSVNAVLKAYVQRKRMIGQFEMKPQMLGACRQKAARGFAVASSKRGAKRGKRA
jgi:uncharacterized protein (DUF4415 family)